MSKTWFCAVNAVMVKDERKPGGGQTNINSQVWPFGVVAEDYYAAVGMANEVMDATRRKYDQFDRWFVTVNRLGGGGLITDPTSVGISEEA